MRTTIPEHEKLFTNKALVSLILPLVIEQFLALSIGMIATMMVSNISEAAVSSISLVDSINVLLIQLFSAIGTGGAVVAAQYLGKLEPLNACKAAKQLLYVSLAISLLITAASIFFCDSLLRLFFGDLESATFGYARTFFLLSALSYPALALYNGSSALMRAMGNSKAPMFTSLMMTVLSVAGNAIFIYGLRMEVAGAGIASLIARTAGAVFITRLLFNPVGRIHLIQPFHPELDRPMTKRIFRVGIPNGLENSIFQIGKLMVAGIVASYGVSLTAANAVSNNVTSFFNLPGSAIGLAMVTVIGQCIGAGDARQARYYTLKLLTLVYLLMAASSLLLFFTARPIAMAFHLSPEAVDAAVELLQYFSAFAALFWPASFTIPNALRAAGDAKFTMGVAILCMWVFRIALSYLLAYTFDMKLLGVWLAMFIDWIARSACFVWRYLGDKWLQQRVV